MNEGTEQDSVKRKQVGFARLKEHYENNEYISREGGKKKFCKRKYFSGQHLQLL